MQVRLENAKKNERNIGIVPHETNDELVPSLKRGYSRREKGKIETSLLRGHEHGLLGNKRSRLRLHQLGTKVRL